MKPDQRDPSRQAKGAYGQPKNKPSGITGAGGAEMVLRPRNAPNMHDSKGNERSKLPTSKPPAGRPPNAAEMLQKRPVSRQQHSSKPSAQPVRPNSPQNPPLYNEWDDKEFLPLHMRDRPWPGAPAPVPPPAKDQRHGGLAPEPKQPHPLAGLDPDHPNPFIRAAVAVVQPAETLQVGKDTYTNVSVLQTVKAQDGGMSQGVFVVHDKETLRWVAKRLSMANKSKRERSEAEVQALWRIKSAVRRHENLNMIREACLPDNEPQGTLIVEYCGGGTLAAGIDSIKKQGGQLSEHLAFHFFYGIAKGLAMLHHGFPDHNNESSRIRGWTTICHLDIKPGNILLSHEQIPGREHMRSPRIVLADFGCSVTSEDVINGREGKIVQENGTSGWFPPEEPAAAPKDTMGRYGKPTDIWQAAGAIQTMCLLLYQPDMTRLQLPLGKKYGPELNCLVATCMSTDYMRRPTAMDLCKELRAVMVRKGHQV